MSQSLTIVTDLFRASHVHLKAKKQFQKDDTPAFRIAALFPQNGVGEIAALGISFDSSPDNIMDAVREVVMAEWNFEYDFDNEKQNKMMGIEYGPYVKNGDMVLNKDSNGNPIMGDICPISGGNFIFNLKNTDDVACASGVDLKPIDVSAPYSGCWGRAQLEVSAYTTKGDTPSRIISIKMINFLMCYDDESFGGHGPAQSADQAFAGMQVTDSNLSVATGNSEFRPEGQNAAPSKPSKPMAKPTPKSLTGTVTMNPDSEYTYQELLDSDFSDQDMIDGGYATLAVVKKAPPAKKVPPAKKAPPAKKPTPKKSVPTTGTVIMKDDSEYTYEQLSVDFEWSDEEIVNGGYATPNFTNPQ